MNVAELKQGEPDYKGLAEALRAHWQIDEDGTSCGVSRQAVCQAAELIESLAAPVGQVVAWKYPTDLAWRSPKEFGYLQAVERGQNIELAFSSPAAVEVTELERAARAVVALRVGELPTAGYLRDTGETRAALGALTAALRRE